MAQKKLVIGLVLDESQSMEGLEDDVIDGFNSYLEELQNQGYEAKLSALKFNSGHGCRVLYQAEDIMDIREMTRENYFPSARTPLYDAVGTMIEMLDGQVVDRETGVLLVVQTDGKENESYKYNSSSLKRLVTDKARQGWKFFFIGVGQSQGRADEVAAGLGMDTGTVLGVSRAATRASFDEIGTETSSLAN